MSRCRETKANGEPCTLLASGPQGLCWAHDPANREQRRRMASRAARSKGNREVATLKEEIKSLIMDVKTGELDRNDAAVIFQGYRVLKDLIALDRKVKETEELGVSRERMWPKSAGWLWKRIKEVLPVLVAVGIEADRSEDNSGSRIALRKVPTGTATIATDSENGEGKPETGGSEAEHAATPTATDGSSTQSTVTGKDDTYGRISSSGTNGSRYEDFSEELTAFLRDPPGWYRRQAAECVRQGVPERLLKPLASAAAYHVVGNTNRRSEVLPYVESALRERNEG